MANHVANVVILAAGNGLRMSSLSPLPKPLVTIQSRPMLDYVFASIAEAHLRRVTVVVGHAADSIRHHVFPSVDGMEIEWVDNPHYSQPNGMSLLCAEGHVRGPFVLAMADHLFEGATLRRFLEQPCPPDGAVLAVDRKVSTLYDLPDATKVLTRDARLEDIGKDLAVYDAIDTGLFLCSEAIFAAMKASASTGRQSLSDGVRLLGLGGRVHTWDVGAASWIDVDTPGARDEAERMVRAGCFSTTSHRPSSRHHEERRPPGAPSRLRRSDRAQPAVQPLTCDAADLVAGRG